ncbi:MAG: hypothetical protein HY904_18825 [Deltaproteobacteria bacterium]|nr:hypothetical protein [Deltaproteobacteria bacterium]
MGLRNPPSGLRNPPSRLQVASGVPWRAWPDARCRVVVAVVPFGLLALEAASPELMRATLGWSEGARVVVTLCVVGVASGPMGTAFPAGLRRFGNARLPWFWAVNGAFGVLGSVLAVVIAMVGGFSSALQGAALLYAGPAALLWVRRPE